LEQKKTVVNTWTVSTTAF